MLLTPLEFAEKFKISVSILRQSRASGSLFGVPSPKHIKIGRNIRYRQEEADNWLAQFEAESEKEGM